MENKEIKPFDKVLVRDLDSSDWKAALYSHYDTEEKRHCASACKWVQCIPYEGNEHLVGTTDSPKPKRWRASMEHSYYYLDSRTLIDIDYEGHSKVDEERYEIGNYFNTREEAEVVAEKIRKIFKEE